MAMISLKIFLPYREKSQKQPSLMSKKTNMGWLFSHVTA